MLSWKNAATMPQEIPNPNNANDKQIATSQQLAVKSKRVWIENNVTPIVIKIVMPKFFLI